MYRVTFLDDMLMVKLTSEDIILWEKLANQRTDSAVNVIQKVLDV